MMGRQGVGVSEDEEEPAWWQLALRGEPVDFGDIEEWVVRAHIGEEGPALRPHGLSELSIEGRKRAAEDLLQFVEEKVGVSLDSVAIAGRVPLKQCK
ncbi:hypothetical protein DAT35_21165 [Vitiosangium sp. GDMCC 1.1324]|nr:hypothetical protein DAT35_21165 [Vitiosangium sp. GDMCC 1.1324]